MNDVPNRDLGAIEKVVWTYLDGLYEGDTKKLAQAFHEVSHLYSAGPDGVADLPRTQWLEAVAKRPSAKSMKAPRTDRIVSVDQSGPETACVKVECSIPPRYFTDYLLLVKAGGEWRIVSKSFRTVIKE
ncbi:MAG: nuclear transport factor 2 family protein [Proteobacteria bacterium]|nr:nuclear transport factor 2 family protein [Pseudomonadota bacterium]